MRDDELGKLCADCRVPLTDGNRGRWSPYWCQPCDKARVERIGRSLERISAGFDAPEPPARKKGA